MTGNVRVSLEANKFTRRAKPIRIIRDPENQRPDKWSSTIYNVVSEEYSKFYYADRELRAEVIQPNVPQHTYLLTHSMVQSPSLEINWFAASQEIPRISRNSEVHFRTHKGPPPVSILDQHNPVHIPTSHLLKIHPNIIHPSTPGSPQWSPSLRFPQHNI